MSTSFKEKKSCCSNERKHLMQDLRNCDYCSTSYDEYQRCYEAAARKSGERSRSCMTPK